MFRSPFSIHNTLAVRNNVKPNVDNYNQVTVPVIDHYKTLKNHLCLKHILINKPPLFYMKTNTEKNNLPLQQK